MWPGVCITFSRRLPTASDVAVVEPHVRERRGAVAMHDDRDAELSAEVMRRREMVGVRVRVDHVTDAQPVTGGEREIAVDLAGSPDRSATAAQVASQPTR